MTDRVARLRQLSLETKPSLSTERAELMTEFYRHAPAVPLPDPAGALASAPDGAQGDLHRRRAS